mmetsp:Transcript_47868/g.63307  ORF Transcript_47868/g.63307 Transcript_47868/m.63307 type:complete len:254 (-) Transcript_47868:782-1543(-)
MHIPVGVLALVPRQAEHIVQEGHFPRSLHVVFIIETVNFFLEDLTGGLWHVDHGVQLLLELGLLALFVVLEYALVCMLEQGRLGAFLELLGCLLNVVKLLVDDFMHLFVQIDELAAANEGVSRLDERVDHRPHPLVVLAEDRLENGEVEVGHLEDDLIEDVRVARLLGVLVDVEKWRLQTLHDHVVPIYNLLGQNHQQLVDLLVVGEPQVLQLEKLAVEQIFLVELHAALRVLCSEGFSHGHIFDWHDLSEVS